MGVNVTAPYIWKSNSQSKDMSLKINEKKSITIFSHGRFASFLSKSVSLQFNL